MTCTSCPLHTSSKVNCIKGVGSGKSGIMFVADFPKETEERFGIPMCGPSGTELDKMLEKIGIRKEDCYITYLVKCRSVAADGSDGTIKKDHIGPCSEHLKQEIDKIKPKVIVPMGDKALAYFFPKGKISERRGIPSFSTDFNAVVFPIYSPAVRVKTNKYDTVFTKDFQLLKKLVDSGMNGAQSEKKTNYIFADTIEKVEEIERRMRDIPLFAFDIETTGLNFKKDKIITIAFSWKKDTAVCIPLRMKDEVASEAAGHAVPKLYWGIQQDYVVSLVKKIMEGPAAKGGHNTPYDILFIREDLRAQVVNYAFDTMIMHNLLDEEAPNGLDDLAWRYTDKGGYESELSRYKKKDDDSYLNIPMEILWIYNCCDTDVTIDCCLQFKEKLKAEGLWEYFINRRMPLQRVLIEVEYEGVLLDVEAAKKAQAEIQKTIDKQVAIISETVKPLLGDVVVVTSAKEITKQNKSRAFNVNSSKQLQNLFFNVLKLTPIKKTKTGYSTDDETLQELAVENPVAKVISDFRTSNKIKSTFIDALIEQADVNHRVHTDYRVAGTKTSRLSSANPNLQNIPRDPDLKKNPNPLYPSIKRLFIPAEGFVFIDADMSQHELRTLAGLSGDPEMRRIFEAGIDIHEDVACNFYGVTADKVTKEMRVIAKKVNFGIAYGTSPKTLAHELHKEGIEISVFKAKEYIEMWHQKFRKASVYLSASVNDFLNRGVITNPYGRKRRRPRLFNDPAQIAALRCEAQNFGAQSTAADIVNKIIVDIYPQLKPFNANIRLTVHDSITIECPKENVAPVAALLKQAGCVRFPELSNVPFRIDISTGLNWSETEDYEEPVQDTNVPEKVHP